MKSRSLYKTLDILHKPLLLKHDVYQAHTNQRYLKRNRIIIKWKLLFSRGSKRRELIFDNVYTLIQCGCSNPFMIKFVPKRGLRCPFVKLRKW